MKTIICACLLMFPSVAFSQNYFTDGTVWKSLLYGTQEPTATISEEFVCLEGDTIVDGENALKMFVKYDDGEKNLLAMIRVDGDKVFFKNETDVKEWSLCYDFGLKKGEGCYVRHLGNPYNVSYVKCEDVSQDSNYGNCTLLSLKEYEDGKCEKCCGKGIWIKGIGSSTSVIRNNQLEVDGGNAVLQEVSCAGNVLYENHTTSLVNTQKDKTVIRLEGLTLKILDVDNGDKVSLYSCDGKLVHSNMFRSDYEMHLPHKGIYVLKIGESVHKVFAY